MPERLDVNQTVQFGVESVPGTPVAANKKFQMLSFSPNPRAEVESFRPTGQKYDAAAAALGAEWSESPLTGRMTYTELVYPFSMIFGTPVITTPADATDARQWVWTPGNSTEDAIKTLTIERGSSFRAHRTSYNLLRELGLNFRRRGANEVTGSILGHELEDGITLTADPTTIPLIPIIGKHLDIFIDDTAEDLGTSKMLRVFRSDVSFGNRFDGFWPIDSSHSSFAGHAELSPTFTGNLLFAADAAGMAMLGDMRDGVTKFIRIQATGPVIEALDPGPGNINYLLQYDFAATIGEPQDFGVEQGLTTIGFRFNGAFDGTWGNAQQITLINKLTAL